MAFQVYAGINAVFTLDGPIGQLMFQDRKPLINACLTDAGEWFKAERIPLRFTDWVYRLGYRVTNTWKAEKRRVLKAGSALPFIGITKPGGGSSGSLIGQTIGRETINPEKMSVAMARGCRVAVSGTSLGGSITIKTPFGHALMPAYAQAFTTVHPSEYKQLTQIVAAALRAYMARAVKPSKRARKLTIQGMNDGWTPRGREFQPRGGGGGTGVVTHRKAS